MVNIAEELTFKASSYFDSITELKGQVPSALLVDFVIEKYKQHRNFPLSYTEEKINADIVEHLTTLAMAVVELTLKTGAEGEIIHNENGTDRRYENAYISSSLFNDIVPFVRIM